MSLVTHKQLTIEVMNGLLKVPASNPAPFNTVPLENINAASIDVRLGQTFWREDGAARNRVVRLKDKESLNMIKVILDFGHEFLLYPGEVVLAQTVEEFYIPNYLAAGFKLKSTGARGALDHSLAGWCDPGWNNSVLTLELQNVSRYHTLALEVGMKIGQVVFFEGEEVDEEASYATRGQYNGDKEATRGKGVK